jgi:hypothetical protein
LNRVDLPTLGRPMMAIVKDINDPNAPFGGRVNRTKRAPFFNSEESERKRGLDIVLTRFLYANQYPLCLKTRWINA